MAELSALQRPVLARPLPLVQAAESFSSGQLAQLPYDIQFFVRFWDVALQRRYLMPESKLFQGNHPDNDPNGRLAVLTIDEEL